MSENHTDTVSAAPPEASLGLTPAMAEAAEIPSPWNEPSADLALPEENADAMPTLALTAAGLGAQVENDRPWPTARSRRSTSSRSAPAATPRLGAPRVD